MNYFLVKITGWCWPASTGPPGTHRVLTTAKELFEMRPADGLRALLAVLDAAAKRRIHIEFVTPADTADLPVDLRHVRTKRLR